jgi:hypothetical protein
VGLFEHRIEVYATGRPESVEKVVTVKRGERNESRRRD